MTLLLNFKTTLRQPLRRVQSAAVLSGLVLSALWPTAPSALAGEVRLSQVINPMTCARDVTTDGLTNNRSFSDNRCEPYFAAAGLKEPANALQPASKQSAESPVASATKVVLGWLSS